MQKQNKGITLVALVITIIILLILAGITISLTIGQQGILRRAEEAGKNYKEAAKKENEELANFLKEADDIINGIAGNEGVSNPLPENAIVKKVEIGDYVAYDPTAGVTDESILTYTSPVGNGMSHGNGYKEIVDGQTFIATSNTKWKVLSKDETTGEVVLISDTPIEQFTMKGAIGYLYEEQELNEICKIYGYGTGANTSKTFRYQTGDVVEELTTGTITGSGARSINAEDINQITKYNPMTFETQGRKYGDSHEHSVFHPSKETEKGSSSNATQRTDKITVYSYKGSQYVTDTKSQVYKMLFENINMGYWLADRGVDSLSDIAYFSAFGVFAGEVCTSFLCNGNSGGLGEYEARSAGIRPIVYLKSNVKTSGKDTNDAWVISE